MPLREEAPFGQMWWQPENSHEAEVRASIDRLVGQVIEHVPPAKLVHGVGAIKWNGRLAPLLIVDRRFDPRRRNDTGVGGPFLKIHLLSKIIYDSVGPLWRLSLRSSDQLGTIEVVRRALVHAIIFDAPRPRDWMFGTLEDAGGNFRSAFANWALPADLIVMFSWPPKALRSLGVAPLIGPFLKRRIGTMGLVGTVNGVAEGFSTAGHVVGQVGTLVSRARRMLGVIFHLGEAENVVLHADPQGLLGYDFALATSRNLGVQTFLARGTIASTPVPDYTPCQLEGTISGGRWGVTNGPLRLAQEDQRLWADCWHISGQRGWFCKQGDSGGLVKLENGAILGTLVGGLKIGGLLGAGRMEIGFVQDLNRTIGFLQRQYGCEIKLS